MASLFADNYSLDAFTRNPSYFRSRPGFSPDISRTPSPLTACHTLSITDLSTKLQAHTLTPPASDISCEDDEAQYPQTHANASSPPSPPLITLPLLSPSPSPTQSSFPSRTSRDVRRQRQAGVLRQCSSSHLREISQLVERMVNRGDQCNLSGPSRSPSISIPSPAADIITSIEFSVVDNENRNIYQEPDTIMDVDGQSPTDNASTGFSYALSESQASRRESSSESLSRLSSSRRTHGEARVTKQRRKRTTDRR